MSEEDTGDRQTLLEPLLPWLPQLLGGVVHHGLPTHTLLNVNVPRRRRVLGSRVAHLGVRDYDDRFEAQSDEHDRRDFWLGGGPAPTPNRPGSDIALLEEGYVTVTPLLLDRTHRDLVPVMRAWVEGDET